MTKTQQNAIAGLKEARRAIDVAMRVFVRGHYNDTSVDYHPPTLSRLLDEANSRLEWAIAELKPTPRRAAAFEKREMKRLRRAGRTS